MTTIPSSDPVKQLNWLLELYDDRHPACDSLHEPANILRSIKPEHMALLYESLKKAFVDCGYAV